VVTWMAMLYDGSFCAASRSEPMLVGGRDQTVVQGKVRDGQSREGHKALSDLRWASVAWFFVQRKWVAYCRMNSAVVRVARVQ
jgi:hypothetical protein